MSDQPLTVLLTACYTPGARAAAKGRGIAEITPMGPRILILFLVALPLAVSTRAAAQPPGGEPPEPEEPDVTEPDVVEPEPEPEEPIDEDQVSADDPFVGAGPAEGDDEDFPDPEADSDRLRDAAAPSSDPTEVDWTAPQTTLTLHGYFRARGELWDTFYLGRDRPSLGDGVPGTQDLPFSRFRPYENGRIPAGGCGTEPEGGTPSVACNTETISFANMRLRLEPTISLSEDVRVHMMFDVFDNMILGSTPETTVWDPDVRASGGYARTPRTPRTPITTQLPPTAYRNSLQDSIVARRAWAEVTNRGLGQLRFGRMGSHWGLGLLANGGEGIDDDYSSDVDRLMAVTKLAGFYFVGAYDFASEGFIQQNLQDPFAYPHDAAQDDDTDQFTFAVARRMDEEEQDATLQRGGWVLNGGIYFVYRHQHLTSAGLTDPFVSRLEPVGAGSVTPGLVRRQAEAFIPDIWVQFLYGGLRIELEAVLIAGSIENESTTSFDLTNRTILQFGGALEAEYRLLDDKLGIYFHTGFATGDSNEEGLVQGSAQGSPDAEGAKTLSTFRFHPNYRVDLILWRNIMGQISGAYYFKPGLSYDFIRNSFGQLFGARVDFIYSRASEPVQTWGNDANLGVEINASLYYRSEDGPELLDGFYGLLQWGYLFPMGGLGYLDGTTGDPPDLENAQILRLLLGVQY